MYILFLDLIRIFTLSISRILIKFSYNDRYIPKMSFSLRIKVQAFMVSFLFLMTYYPVLLENSLSRIMERYSLINLAPNCCSNPKSYPSSLTLSFERQSCTNPKQFSCLKSDIGTHKHKSLPRVQPMLLGD